MYLCAICGVKSQRNETPIIILQEVRDREYPEGGIGWEIVREGPVPPSHKHGLKFNTEYNRYVPYLGFHPGH